MNQEKTEAKSYEHGPQPIDELLNQLELKNVDIVRASNEHLTFKVVQKARRGRELTKRAQVKIMNALNTLSADTSYSLSALFNYRGR